jgi:CheY-like chemotaxis protein
MRPPEQASTETRARAAAAGVPIEVPWALSGDRGPHAPSSKGRLESEQARGDSAQESSKDCILLVEDNPADVLIIRMALKQNGVDCELVVMTDGEKALNHLENIERTGGSKPSLIVLDLNLPRLSGREVLQHIQQELRWHDVPVVILSSADSARDRQITTELGAAMHLRKPLGLTEFLSVGGVLKQFLEKRSSDPQDGR